MKLFTSVVLSLLLQIISINAIALSNSVAAEAKGWESNVLIAIPGIDPADGTDSVGHCNGTLINDRTLITAAHCFLKSFIPRGDKMRIEIGEYRYVIKDGVKIKIGYRTMIRHESSAKLRLLPGVNLNGTSVPPELDIAVVKLDQPVSPGPEFIYAELWNQALPQLTAASKPTLVSVNVMETISHMDTKQMAVLNKFTQSRYNIESTSTSRVAPGDSGAPLFAVINGKTYLVGVVKGTVKYFGSAERDILVTLQGRLNLQ